MASKRELQALVVLAGKVDPGLQKAMRKATKQVDKFNQQSSLIGKTMTKGFDIAKSAAKTGAFAIGAALAYTGYKGLELASDLNEVQNVVDVTFGNSSKQIDNWSKKALKSYGLSELAAKQYTGTMGAMLKSSGVSNKNLVTMSENLTALTGDFASFYNLNADEAFQKIRAGISGETEPLKQLGINMNVANLQAYALSKGIKTKWQNMDQATQTMLRYNYLLKVSKDAQGDFNRTSDDFANQRRLFSEGYKNLSASVMKAAIPSLTKLIQKGNELMDKFASDPEKMQKIQDVIANIGDKVIETLPKAIQYAKKFGKMIGTVFKRASEMYYFIHDNWPKIKPVILTLVGATLMWRGILKAMAIIESVSKMLKYMNIVMKSSTILKFKDAAATMYLKTLYLKDAIAKGASTAATWAWSAATKVARIGTLAAAAAQWALNSSILANPMTWVIVGIVAAIAALVAGFIWVYKNWDKVQKFLVNTVDMVKHAFAVGVNWIVDKLNFLIKKINHIPHVEIPLIPKMDEGDYDKIAKAQKLSNSSTPTSYEEMPTMKKFALGGFANRPSIFGEAGPEVAIPIKRTPRSLSLLNQTAQALGVSGVSNKGNGNGVTIYNNPIIYGSNSQEIKKALESSEESLFKKIDEYFEAKRRESYA